MARGPDFLPLSGCRTAIYKKVMRCRLMYLVAAIHVILVEVGGIGFEFPLAPAPPSRPTVS